jgi:hypothetical protein
MNRKEPEGMDASHLLIPTIGRLKGVSDKQLNALLETSVLDAMAEIRGLRDFFGIPNNWRIRKTYTELDDAASFIEATVESMSDIASDMRHISREMEGRDRIDG